MTTRTAVAQLPLPGLRLRTRTIVGFLAVAIAATLVFALLALRSSQSPEVTGYLSNLAPVTEHHNEVMNRWNSFVTVHNATATLWISAYDDQAAAAYAEVSAIAAEAEAVRSEWASIQPPTSHAEPYALVLEAMRLTSAGIAGVADYFADARTGEASIEQARAALALIAEASGYWSRARAFES